MNKERIEAQRQEVRGFSIARNLVFGAEAFYGGLSAAASVAGARENDYFSFIFAASSLIVTAGISFWRRKIEDRIDQEQRLLRNYLNINSSS